MKEYLEKESIKIIIKTLKRGRSVFFLGLFMSAFGAITSILLPYLAKLELDQLVGQVSHTFFGVPFSPYGVFLAILGVIFFVSFIDKLISDIAEWFLREREEIFTHEIQLFFLERLSHMEVGISLSTSFQNILRFVSNKLENIVKIILSIPKSILGMSIQFIGISSILLSIDWRIFVTIFIGGSITYIFEKKKYENSLKQGNDPELKNIEQITWSIPWELRRSLAELSRNGAIQKMLQSFTGSIHKKQLLVRKYQKKNIQVRSIIFIVDNCINFIIKAGVAYAVFQGTQSVGVMTMAVLYIGKISSLFHDGSKIYFDYSTIRFDLRLFDEFLRIIHPAGSDEGKVVTSSITFKQVHFSYPDTRAIEEGFYDIIKENLALIKSQKQGGMSWMMEQIEKDIEEFERDEKEQNGVILEDFNYTFIPGRIYGIVGKNGAGKTTLISLLSGFFRSYEGEILFDDTPTKHWNMDGFAKNISVISQSPYIYDAYGEASVRNNLTLGITREVSDAEIYELLEVFGLDKKIRKTAKGLDSEVRNDIDLSGGQYQLLAIIRIILQDRPILVFDEGTNQLDAENEALVMQYLLKKCHQKIIFFITHRMNTIARADEVLCLEGGRIQSRGTPKELLDKNDNAYARFYRTQILHEE